MNTVHVSASRDYDVHIGTGILPQTGPILRDTIGPRTAAVVTDDIVDSLYGDTVCASLEQAGFRVCRYVFPNGEKSKSAGTYIGILEFLAENRLTRSDLLIALGGGVVGDITGFAAATYLRGLDYVQVPTTFLAAADSSTGGKTAINLGAGKNLAGAFHLPRMVLCDCGTFQTLPEPVFADGTAETLKHGLIADGDFFRRLAAGSIHANLEETVRRDVEIKSSFVSRDEHDNGVRQMLNFGHTVGHAIEKCSGYAVTHGHAVAAGMVVVSRAAYKLGLTGCDCADEIAAALSKNGLPVSCPYDADALFQIAAGDKKRSGGTVNVICLEEIGRSKSVPLEIGALRDFIAAGLT